MALPLCAPHPRGSSPVLCSDGRPYELTLPHMADRDSEAARIRAGGGFVTYNGGKPRVAGILQVHAGIG